MKTSNYIIIAFFVFLFGSVFVLFLTSKSHYNKGGLYTGEKKLEPFSVVVAEPGAAFHLRNGEYPRMLGFYEKPDTCKFLKYGIRNDTLFVFADPGSNKPRFPHEIYGRNIKSIVAKENSNVSLQQFQADTLAVSVDHATLEAFFDKTQTSSLSIVAEKSKVNLSGAQIDNLNIQLNNTKMQTWNNSIVSLSGSLKNDSYVTFQELGKITIEVDQTSAYQITK